MTISSDELRERARGYEGQDEGGDECAADLHKAAAEIDRLTSALAAAEVQIDELKNHHHRDMTEAHLHAEIVFKEGIAEAVARARSEAIEECAQIADAAGIEMEVETIERRKNGDDRSAHYLKGAAVAESIAELIRALRSPLPASQTGEKS